MSSPEQSTPRTSGRARRAPQRFSPVIAEPVRRLKKKAYVKKRAAQTAKSKKVTAASKRARTATAPPSKRPRARGRAAVPVRDVPAERSPSAQRARNETNFECLHKAHPVSSSKNIDVDRVDTGDWLSCVVYFKKTGADAHWTENGGQVVKPVGVSGITNDWKYSNLIVEKTMWTATDLSVNETRKITREQMVDLWKTSLVSGHLFRATFYTKPKVKEATASLVDAFEGRETMSERDLKNAVKEVIAGKKTVITGYMKSMRDTGHAQVISLPSLSAPGPDRGIRLVDVRTVEEVIYRGVRYLSV